MKAGISSDVSAFTRGCSKQRTLDKETVTIVNFSSMEKTHLHGKNFPKHYVTGSTI